MRRDAGVVDDDVDVAGELGGTGDRCGVGDVELYRYRPGQVDGLGSAGAGVDRGPRATSCSANRRPSPRFAPVTRATTSSVFMVFSGLVLQWF
jgi:hypothetical protein